MTFFILLRLTLKKQLLSNVPKSTRTDSRSLGQWRRKPVNFLDLTITCETGYLSFKPYCKPLNSSERLPFTSAHPLHVKRAAFLGEVSRISRLCSKYDTYYNEIAHVRDIYRKRAYPPHFLYTWIRQESRNRWDSRYTNKNAALEGSPFWLKSVYNDVWKYIDLRKAWTAMENMLNKDETPLVEYDSIKLSLKKFKNLVEMNNKMNADEQSVFLAEEEGPNCEMDRSPSPTESVDYLHIAW